MPYEIATDSPDCKGYAVRKPDTLEVVGCHEKRSDAIAHIRALYINVPDAVAKASAEDLVALHEQFHKKYASPDTDTIIESHHWLAQGLKKLGIRLPSEPDWESAIASSKWEITADGVDLEELGLTDDPLVAKMVDDWENGGSNFLLGEVFTEDGLEWVIKQANVEMDDVLKIAEDETFSPPAGVKAEGKRALAWIKEGHQGDGFTDVGRARAAQLAAGRPVSLRTIRRMHSYFIRHKNDKEGKGYTPDQKGYPSPGRVAWAAWGGNAGKTWAESIVRRAENAEKSVNYDMIKAYEERKFTLGPMYIPDRVDAHGEWTDSEELQAAVWNYVKSDDRRIRLQHNKDIVAGEWVEIMTFPYELTVPMKKSDGTSSSVTYPPNTVFLGVQWNDWAWDLVKSGKLRGYSIGGKAVRMMADLPEVEIANSDPSVSSVHLDTIMGKPKREKK
jgi:hypothetical protein